VAVVGFVAAGVWHDWLRGEAGAGQRVEGKVDMAEQVSNIESLLSEIAAD
jgi:hypothetical protein